MARRAKPIPKISSADIERFWRLVDRRGSDECWPWKGTKSKPPHHYGAFHLGSAQNATGMYRAPRVLWTIHHGNPPTPDEDVLHTCDNPPCCNPAHLFLGDHAKNMQDRRAKGRYANQPRGEANPEAKLTAEVVTLSRQAYARGENTVRGLAKQNNVSKRTMERAILGVTWAHLPLVADEVGAGALRHEARCRAVSVGLLGYSASETCSFIGCGKVRSKLGLCGAHYMQKHRGEELRPLRVFHREKKRGEHEP